MNQPTPLAPSMGTGRSRSTRMDRGAYWYMMKYIIFASGGANFIWIFLFWAFGAHWMAASCVVSVLMYLLGYWLLVNGHKRAVTINSWVQVVGHSSLACVLLGWDSGYSFYLWMVALTAAVGGGSRANVLATVALFLYYLALESLCQSLGPLTPLPDELLRFTRWMNAALIFAVYYAVASFYRRTVLKVEQVLLERATTDPLTQLSNRSHFMIRAQVEMAHAQRNRQPMAVILTDLDHFKLVNDAHGHTVGDQVLQHVAGLLRAQMRGSDTLARWGGEEFLMLLPATTLDAARELAERLREAVCTTPFVREGGSALALSISLGVCELPPGSELNQAIECADRALYESKRLGRNRVTCAERH